MKNSLNGRHLGRHGCIHSSPFICIARGKKEKTNISLFIFGNFLSTARNPHARTHPQKCAKMNSLIRQNQPQLQKFTTCLSKQTNKFEIINKKSFLCAVLTFYWFVRMICWGWWMFREFIFTLFWNAKNKTEKINVKQEQQLENST